MYRSALRQLKLRHEVKQKFQQKFQQKVRILKNEPIIICPLYL
jgi:hypothetical protein